MSLFGKALALYNRYELSHPALFAIMHKGGWSLRWTGVILGPVAIGIMWRERAPKDGVA